MTAVSATRLAPESHHAAPAPAACSYPLVGIGAVLLGAIISTLYGRLTNVGLADIRGGVGAGFDEGAWIPTAATVAQMFIGPPASWLGAVFGVRRVLLVSASAFALTSTLIPLAPDLHFLLLGQAVGGLASGTFIPLTIGFVLQNLKPAWWPYGIAAYGLNLELSLNIPASLEGFYLDHLSWHWIFWQGAVLAVPMIACIAIGMPRQKLNRDVLGRTDFWGMLHAGSGFSLLYAALDQGNRLDWLNSGTICGLLAGGIVLIAAFAAHEASTPYPWINPRFLLGRNILLLISVLALYRFVLLGTSFLIPQYLTTVQEFRSLQIGPVLLLIALPQFILAPVIATVLRFVEPRYVLAFGAGTIGIACLLAMQLTPQWQTVEFLPSQILQAIGQSSALIALVLFFVRHLKPADALTFGAVLQTARLFGGELGSAFMQTYQRISEQTDSFLVGLHVQEGSVIVGQNLSEMAAAVGSRASNATEASLQATALISNAIRAQANVLSTIDGFGAVVVGVVLMLGLIALLRDP